MADTKISGRLLDQCLRNRLMEAVLGLTEGNQDVRSCGASDYFNVPFDFTDADYQYPAPNSAMTEDEAAALREVYRLLNQACAETPQNVSEDQLVASGWPERIAPVAREALALFMAWGRSSESVEDDLPSG